MKRISNLALLLLLALTPLLAAGCAQAQPTSYPNTGQLPGTQALLSPKSQNTPASSPPTATTAPIPTETSAPPTATSAPTAAATPNILATKMSMLLPNATPVTTPTLNRVDWIDPSDAWALGQGTVLHSLDGGKQWYDVTPPGLQVSYAPSSFFLNNLDGWVVAQRGETYGNGTIYITHDGGGTWVSYDTNFSGGYIDFINTQTGWVEDFSDCGAGSCGGSMYATTDGGKTWTTVTEIAPGRTNQPNGLPFAGDKSGVTFIDAQHGWATGQEPMDNYAWLFKTEDGGKTWQHQDIPLPNGVSTAMLPLNPPHFFSATDGILPATVFQQSTQQMDFYVTHDGGQTWTPTTLVDGSGTYSILSMQDIWVWNGGPLYVTHDGGQTWQTITTNIDLSQTLSQFSFVSPEEGFATSMNANGQTEFYRTTDGGKTWESLFPQGG